MSTQKIVAVVKCYGKCGLHLRSYLAILGLMALLVSCNSQAPKPAKKAEVGKPEFRLTKLELGKTYTFKTGGSGLVFLKSGFSGPEETHVWTDGPEAVVSFETPQAETDLTFSLRTAVTFAPKTLGEDQFCEVSFNGKQIATWKLFEHPTDQPFTATIPKELVKPGKAAQLSFKFNKLTSPKLVGESVDARLLGLAFQQMEISAGPAAK